MKTIRISDEVWSEIAKRGKFGETPDAVLRRVFKLDQGTDPGVAARSRTRQATRRISPRVQDDKLTVRIEGGPSRQWSLPSRSDKQTLRKLTYEAMDFAKNNGATEGQILAVRKALTDAGYHLTK